MRFQVLEARFHTPLPSLGSSAWHKIAAGKYAEAEYDTEAGILSLIPRSDVPDGKKRRIPCSNVAEMVFGPTLANK